jgi:hypothetical protein
MSVQHLEICTLAPVTFTVLAISEHSDDPATLTESEPWVIVGPVTFTFAPAIDIASVPVEPDNNVGVDG